MNKFIGCAIALVAGGVFAVDELPRMSPFDDVKYWFRGGVDLSGNGVYDSGSYECRDVAHAANATHANHKMTLAQTSADYDPLRACTGTVVMPYAGQALTDAPYLHLPQRVETNGMFEAAGVSYPIVKLHANYVNLPNFLADLPNGHCGEYTVFVRFRDQSRVSDLQSEHNLFQLGYGWVTGVGGIAVNLQHNGQFVYLHPYFAGSQKTYDNDNFKFKYGQWGDLAVIVKDEGRTVEFAACPNLSDSPMTNRLFAYTRMTTDADFSAAIPSSRRWCRIGGEAASCGSAET